MTYKIRDLGVISDRRSGAVIAKNGDVCWHCPGQFDSPSLFASLLDSEKGGLWSLNLQGCYDTRRQYIENSSADDESQKKRWLENANAIRHFVKNNCITHSGSYAVFSGSDEVDITATLFPEWDYCPADTPEMVHTVKELEENFSKNDLVYRNLLLFDEEKEGAFLAANFWMAQYWIMRKNIRKSKRYIEAALKYQNDLGLFAEEADPDSDAMLGNIPQSFVHASCIGAIIDFNNAFGNK
ncbi:MAG TPA: glycoside hydrolase family 15 protein [Bacteroidales bacterium]|nr:glycoside hydrolase family 15 protein [Bacteroidales bacterium]